jgi:probable F420-dependent oxidoreductase
MRIGAILPQTEIGPDPGRIRYFGQAVEQLGFDHLVAYDHVLGADPSVHGGWDGPYDVDTEFHEPFVVFGFLAGITSLELVTGILILPQRQTALVAKQAAEVDLLTQGKLRLGVGIGWNAVEYGSLGQDFTVRGRRVEEQVDLLRKLWTCRSVTFEGEFDRVVGAGIAPLPVQRPIPIWFGGFSPKVYDRIGRLADGWFPLIPPGDQLDEALAIIRAGAESSGRDPASISMEGRVNWSGDLGKAIAECRRWADVGASHVSINTMGAGLSSVEEHVEILGAIAGELGLGASASV